MPALVHVAAHGESAVAAAGLVHSRLGNTGALLPCTASSTGLSVWLYPAAQQCMRSVHL